MSNLPPLPPGTIAPAVPSPPAPALSRQSRQFSRKIRLSTSVQFDTSTIIEGFLFLGAKGVTADREKLAAMNVKYIIGVSEDDPPEYGKDLEYLHIMVGDTPEDDISLYFDASFDFIERARRDGKGVLVHCTMGMSRSATLVLAYLIRHNDWSLAESITYIKARRPVASPNPGFMAQLVKYEHERRGSVTVNVAQYANNRFGEVTMYCIKDND